MGLDISYYRRLVPAPDAPKDEYGEHDYMQFFTLHDGEDRRAADLKPGVYSFDERDSFRAGSYGGYNAWRSELAKFAGYESSTYVWDNREKVAGQPFVELIDFSDCEGVIGPSVSAKLARDFATFQVRADTHPDEYCWPERQRQARA